MPLEQLRVLWLSDNPCCQLPHYRAFVVAQLPQLESLDNVPIRWVSCCHHLTHSTPLANPA
jgi:hypothetical protein